MTEAVILDASRTPFGRRGGVYREFRPDALLAHTLAGLVEHVGLQSAQIEDVVTGCVTQAGEQGANVGRLALLLADFPVTVPGVTLNRMCGSSQQAVHFAAQAIAAGDMRYAIGCGVENMTRAPMFHDIDPGGRLGGYSGLNPALFEKQDLIHQGLSAELVAERWNLSRKALDAYAAESHRRATAARANGPTPELLPAPGLDPDGQPVQVTVDEGVREHVDPEAMASLQPAFREDGVITAANASQIADGASAVLVADRAAAEADGFRPRARFRARVVVGDDPRLQLMGIVPASRNALERAGLGIADLDWIEVNEAFASVVLAWACELDAPMDRVNPWGGAVAHGHPLGATGGGLMAKLLAGLEVTDGQFGLQVMCIGHGMATATVVERL